MSPYLQDLFEGWSPDVHRILKATREDEIEQRDLYDRPPSVIKKWGAGKATLLGDSVHAMLPNLGQGGCQVRNIKKYFACFIIFSKFFTPFIELVVAPDG